MSNNIVKKIIIIGAFIVLAAMVASYKFSGLISRISNTSQAVTDKSDIGQEEATKKIESFVSSNLVKAGTDVSVKDVTKDGNLYKATVTIQKKDYVMYLTSDGKKFFPEGMDTDVQEKVAATEAETAPAKDIPKNDAPIVDLYVMSFCPFGNKAEDTLKSAYNLLKNKVKFNFHYIVSANGDDIQSLHGAKEVAQDEREACVLKNYGKDKWIDFVTYVNKNCGSDGSCWEAGAKSMGVDTVKINSCVSSEGVALMKANGQESDAAGASGSPTMTINGVETESVYQYGNSETYKQVICSAFNNPPSECSETLSSATATTQGGSCAN